MRIHGKDLMLVSLQFILFGCYAIDVDWSLGVTVPVEKTGLIIAIVGFFIALTAVLQLNKNLSPFPTPNEQAVLLENGLFQFVRHPIYSGLLLLFYGCGIYVDSIYKLLISCFLLLLFYFKTNYEESQLERKFPDYSNYKLKAGRFLPKMK
jgi:protein-S-isoprenylcysteine O-methyltransferase Ste14